MRKLVFRARAECSEDARARDGAKKLGGERRRLFQNGLNPLNGVFGLWRPPSVNFTIYGKNNHGLLKLGFLEKVPGSKEICIFAS